MFGCNYIDTHEMSGMAEKQKSRFSVVGSNYCATVEKAAIYGFDNWLHINHWHRHFNSFKQNILFSTIFENEKKN